MNRTSHSGLIESKKDRISASRIQLILHALIPYASASSASCWPPGSEPVAKPQELRLVDRREDRHHRRLDYLMTGRIGRQGPRHRYEWRNASKREPETMSVRIPSLTSPIRALWVT